jgi:uncharacterized protein YcbK (DUF882 family)
MNYVAEYITENEYKCTCCDGYPPDFDVDDVAVPYGILFDSFRSIREAWGKPIRITSGYRCPMNNAMVGGKVLSAHMFGLALDLDVDNIDEVYELDEIIEDIAPDLRRGRYTDSGSFIHIDTAYFIYPRATVKWREGARWTG